MSTETFAIDEHQQRIEKAVIDEEAGASPWTVRRWRTPPLFWTGDILGSFKQGGTALNSDVLGDAQISDVSLDEHKATVTFGEDYGGPACHRAVCPHGTGGQPGGH